MTTERRAGALQLSKASRDDVRALWPTFHEIVLTGETYVQDATTTEDEFVAFFCDRGGEQWIAREGDTVLGGYSLRANHPGRGAHVGTAAYVVAREARGRGRRPLDRPLS